MFDPYFRERLARQYSEVRDRPLLPSRNEPESQNYNYSDRPSYPKLHDGTAGNDNWKGNNQQPRLL